MLFDPDEREEVMEIQRYIIKQDPISLPEMVPYTQGAYCLYSDHLKEKDAIISTRTEVAHQLQDALSVRDRQIATLTAEKDKLKEALKKLAKFRSECHAYDLDMGNPLREFGNEEWGKYKRT